MKHKKCKGLATSPPIHAAPPFKVVIYRSRSPVRRNAFHTDIVVACIVMQGTGYGGVQAEEGKSKRAGRGVQRSARPETGCSTVWVGKRESVVHLPLCETERGERPLRGAVRTGAASIRCLASAPQARLSQSKAAWPVTVSRWPVASRGQVSDRYRFRVPTEFTDLPTLPHWPGSVAVEVRCGIWHHPNDNIRGQLHVLPCAAIMAIYDKLVPQGRDQHKEMVSKADKRSTRRAATRRGRPRHGRCSSDSIPPQRPHRAPRPDNACDGRPPQPPHQSPPATDCCGTAHPPPPPPPPSPPHPPSLPSAPLAAAVQLAAATATAGHLAPPLRSCRDVPSHPTGLTLPRAAAISPPTAAVAPPANLGRDAATPATDLCARPPRPSPPPRPAAARRGAPPPPPRRRACPAGTTSAADSRKAGWRRPLWRAGTSRGRHPPPRGRPAATPPPPPPTAAVLPMAAVPSRHRPVHRCRGRRWRASPCSPPWPPPRVVAPPPPPPHRRACPAGTTSAADSRKAGWRRPLWRAVGRVAAAVAAAAAAPHNAAVAAAAGAAGVNGGAVSGAMMATSSITARRPLPPCRPLHVWRRLGRKATAVIATGSPTAVTLPDPPRPPGGFEHLLVAGGGPAPPRSRPACHTAGGFCAWCLWAPGCRGRPSW
ncbi:hypothetical protein BU14_0247s0006 [Porphyra umbilicalis]|uniref:Uncharacterized protein n=1 Tax=Porphyra umbilicalis TaxID=2786 RepID=A0A1X6P2Z1_PORUM|nr:hypothetical protein BU14_0247s0006 [Porphyra umbilicalis]OSX75209.1 hypothetical protein BU14_0247s0006 [Porphyra umbilicalis]|eukprot:OSX75208.1 hypothetical protein BU14_0247s0006 [Porphyra umbilicalis]